MDNLHSKIKCLIYHRSEHQYLHTCGELKFQYGRRYGRQKLKHVYLRRHISDIEKWGVDLYNFKVRESIPCSNSLDM